MNLSVATPRSELLPMGRLAALHARALRRDPEASLAYDTSPGRYGLRQNIAKRLLDVGCAVGAEEITVTSGCFDAITVSPLATCRPGDTVAIALLQLFEGLGLQVIDIHSSARTGLNIDVLEFTPRRQPVAACITVPNFSNPLGSLMHAGEPAPGLDRGGSRCRRTLIPFSSIARARQRVFRLHRA